MSQYQIILPENKTATLFAQAKSFFEDEDLFHDFCVKHQDAEQDVELNYSFEELVHNAHMNIPF